MPFLASSWFTRGSVPSPITPESGYQVPMQHKAYVWSGVGIGGTPDTIEGHTNVVSVEGYSFLTMDDGASWTQVSGGVAGDRVYKYFSIKSPDGTNYFRIRQRFYTSFFLANPSMYPGYLELQTSTDGLSWNAAQKFYQWNHDEDPGAGSRAVANNFIIGPILLPGTGPGGADADWLLIRSQVTSSSKVGADDYAWWRSDDYGFTWTRVRTQSAVDLPVPNYLVRSPSGRIISGTIEGRYSDDNGLTWTSATGLTPNNKVGSLHFAGNSWATFHAGGLGSTPGVSISCDNGANYVGSFNFGGSGGVSVTVTVVRLSASEVLAIRSDGGRPFYSNDGGETWQDGGAGAPLGLVIHAALVPDGRPLIVNQNATTAMSSDRATGTFKTRTMCPLAFANLKKAGLPNLCGHPMLQNRC